VHKTLGWQQLERVVFDRDLKSKGELSDFLLGATDQQLVSMICLHFLHTGVTLTLFKAR
jgi:hypothetical protein